MKSQAKKHARYAPRYNIGENEARGIRFRTLKNPRVVLTKIVDISETGISFTSSHRLSPKVGELFNMDFAPPGSLQIAVQGRVVRVEEPTKDSDWAQFPGTVKIGVVFHNVPKPYKKILTRTLTNLFETRHQQFAREVVENRHGDPSWILENAGSIVITFIVLLTFAGAFYYFLNYYEPSKSTETPWAQNFFDKHIPKPAK